MLHTTVLNYLLLVGMRNIKTECTSKGNVMKVKVKFAMSKHIELMTERGRFTEYSNLCLIWKNNKKYRECSYLQTVSEISGPVLLSIINRFVEQLLIRQPLFLHLWPAVFAFVGFNITQRWEAKFTQIKKNSVVLVHKRTIPIERSPPVSEASAKFSG
jgi:hypothetical protein